MASAVQQRKRPARMTLARDVGRAEGDTKMTRKAISPGPFSGMNQTEARVERRVPPRVRTTSEKANTRSSTRPSVGSKERRTKEEKPLVHALKMQTTLTPLSFNQRTILKERLDKIDSFEQFDLLPDLKSAIYTQALPGMKDLVPTPAQKLAIPALLSQKGQYEKTRKKGDTPQFDQFLIAAETGSGKTLAYLLPVIDAFKRQEEIEKIDLAKQEQEDAGSQEKMQKENVFNLEAPETDEAQNPSSGRPRVLILLPSSELVTQVGRVLKSISHTVKYKSAALSASHTPNYIRNNLFTPRGIDVVVSTPHLISSIAEKEPHILSRVNHLVVDEADSLLDRSFAPITCGIIDRTSPSLKQLILCSATIPRSLDTFMDRRFPEIKRLVTPKLHTIPRRVQLGVIDVDRLYRGNKNLACADTIWQIGKAPHDDDETHHTVRSMIVFVNEREHAEEVATYLASKGIEAVALTRDTQAQRSSDILSAFTSWTRVQGDAKEQTSPGSRSFRDFVPFANDSSSSTDGPSRRLSNVRVLVTTDLGSRGLDTMSTRFVILHGIPHTTIDFIHRIGRLGRMGRRGRAVALVDKNDRKDVVAEVKRLAFRGQPLI